MPEPRIITELARRLKRLFQPVRGKTPERHNVIYPFRPMLNAMWEKDPALTEEVGGMVPAMAVQRWREVYPEDFKEL